MYRTRIILLLFTLFLLSNRGGRNAPSVAAPGDGFETCSSCHGGGNFQTNVAVKLIDPQGNSVDKYQPEKTYIMEVTAFVDGGNMPSGYGFQLVALDTVDNKQAGKFDSLGQDVRKLTIKQRDYIMQSRPRSDGTFRAKWTAPPAETGGVKIYVSANAVNGNNNTNGDRNLTTQFEFGEDITQSAFETNHSVINLYPNPVRDELNVSGYTGGIEIRSFSGAVIAKQENAAQVDMSTYPSGLYFAVLEDGRVVRFIKI